jgi:polar amino acid transport system substrate-binding protein
MKRMTLAALACAAVFATPFANAAEVPAPGSSPRIDAIKKAGVLKVAVIHNTPWLVQNTTGSGEPWSGPAWILANAVAKDLGVKLQTVPVSNETKVPVLAANQVDISIAPLAETEPRLKVVDFILYSSTSVCLFGLKNNPKVANAKTVDDLNNGDVTVAVLLGAAEEPWVKERLPKANVRGVITSALIPIDEVLARRADVAPINRIQWPALQKKMATLDALPREANCQQSNEKAQPVGMAIDKGQDAFLNYLRTKVKEMATELTAADNKIIAEQL